MEGRFEQLHVYGRHVTLRSKWNIAFQRLIVRTSGHAREVGPMGDDGRYPLFPPSHRK